ncbi:multidrug resistance efflux transporter family protein [Bacillus lacus]|uniref:Multidrug resistance efflux transporter family protein n=1 Tax=Metabacillus lacus TaxID=1983721 RepID=A0A7X2J0N9_9BACI|nr:multidrug resistance efflux transporter family protein [Metabacillus lacus]MRX73276.1 multidrug resistance efflux transporter family protein [Metabacillus lacus]
MKEISLGMLASVFFAVTFVLNRSMELSGGSWLWSSSLRFFFMLPFLFLIVALRGNLKELITEMKSAPFQWLIWSFFGFLLFYAPITFAAAYGPGWLVAGTWQTTIVAGTLLSPLFFYSKKTGNGEEWIRHKIPKRELGISVFILAGVVLIQVQRGGSASGTELAAGMLPVVVAAFAYPLGNRKMMEFCKGKIDTFQRILGMTISSLPFWIVIAAAGYAAAGPPQPSQLAQSFIVAVCSGVIATILFFMATDRVRDNQSRLASVEATQSAQVVFVLLGEILLLSSPLPNQLALAGMGVIVAGVILHSLQKNKKERREYT